MNLFDKALKDIIRIHDTIESKKNDEKVLLESIQSYKLSSLVDGSDLPTYIFLWMDVYEKYALVEYLISNGGKRTSITEKWINKYFKWLKLKIELVKQERQLSVCEKIILCLWSHDSKTLTTTIDNNVFTVSIAEGKLEVSRT